MKIKKSYKSMIQRRFIFKINQVIIYKQKLINNFKFWLQSQDICRTALPLADGFKLSPLSAFIPTYIYLGSLYIGIQK